MRPQGTKITAEEKGRKKKKKKDLRFQFEENKIGYFCDIYNFNCVSIILFILLNLFFLAEGLELRYFVRYVPYIY